MGSRKNATLTTEDRRWLTGGKVYEGEHAKQQRYQRRTDIRERVSNALLDFSILSECLEEKERRRIFESLSDGDDTSDAEGDELFEGSPTESRSSCTAPTSPIRAVGARVRFPTTRSRSASSTRDSLGAEEIDEFVVNDVDLTVDAVSRSASEAAESVKNDARLSDAELRLLLESDLVETEDVQHCLRALLPDEDA